MSCKPFLLQNQDLSGCRVTVLGLGRFGGGIAVTQFLAARGAQITVLDAKTAAELEDSLDQLQDIPQVSFILGEASPELPPTDLLVVNPAIPPRHPLLIQAEAEQIPVTSEIELFWQLNPARVVGVTGSNGKSTTTAMIHSVFSVSGAKCWLGGNIGVSLLPVVDQIQPVDWVILELSSFQLFTLDRLQVSPQIAVVTNFSPNHLDWHQTLEHYRHSKQAICRWQTSDETVIINADDPDLRDWDFPGNVLTFGSNADLNPDVLVEEQEFVAHQFSQKLQPQLKVPGWHNRMNAAAAITAGICTDLDRKVIQQGLESFEGLPHRLQFIGEFAGRRFYNDSLATTPESAICALEAFEPGQVIALAGGYDKKVDLTPFSRELFTRTKATALMGDTGVNLHELMTNQRMKNQPNADVAISEPQQSFKAAFDWAFQQSAPGDVILLSPGCASYGWFSNFQERGARFESLFRKLSQNSPG
ncbi:UDP-N-acetylmuramoyl-L-alanine--D-glutamate ligase [Gimesia panareensis]|uniref:UDP-N-acetylmuramoylalanine--D-glutamate ligase n=1 Tax=Gimesia panareensis TaxID=2527978 RepID=A0A518A795_9PLAN|nr:UDP-N-acetylmuramoyl-L-alanine--D-glutamate ligase [Gimesia panareensis]QDT26556.1 UDP-N-acetylmuramoylalanine--D-glutamate ligase MurD [Gimesia panareensis]QDU50565.1 UDP-N-acetylmuramoylalanine--D-glutamate ligase MurD [Gimesia panareensis]